MQKGPDGDEEEPIGHRLRRGLQGQEAPHRPARLATQPRPHLGPGEKPREPGARVAAREDTQLEGGALAAPDRHRPEKAVGRDLATEVDLDGVGGLALHLDLRRVQHVGGQAQAELAMEAIGDAAGEDAGPGVDGSRAREERDAVGVRRDLVHPRARAHGRPGALGLLGQAPVELRPIHGQELLRARPRPRHVAGASAGGDEAGAPRAVEHEVLGDLGQRGRLEGDDARAVDGLTDVLVLFEDGDVEARLGAAAGGQEAGRAAPHDRDIVHAAMIAVRVCSTNFCGTGSICFAILRCERAGSPQRTFNSALASWLRPSARTPTYASGCRPARAWQFELRAQPEARAGLMWLATCPSARGMIRSWGRDDPSGRVP